MYQIFLSLVHFSPLCGCTSQAKKIQQFRPEQDMLIHFTHYITFFFFYWSIQTIYLTAPSCAFPKRAIRRICRTHPAAHPVPQRPLFITEHFMWLYWVLKGALHPHSLLWNLLFERAGGRQRTCCAGKHGREKWAIVLQHFPCFFCGKKKKENDTAY